MDREGSSPLCPYGLNMRYLLVILLSLLLCFAYISGTIRFKSIFHDDFYSYIVNTPFDVTRKNETLSININNKYGVCHDLGIDIPGNKFGAYPKYGPGKLKYRFISKDKVLAEGVIDVLTTHSLGGMNNSTTILLMVFDLPFKGNINDLVLELTVIEPFSFLEEYKGQTSIVINPNYSDKFDKCYNEELRIEQP